MLVKDKETPKINLMVVFEDGALFTQHQIIEGNN